MADESKTHHQFHENAKKITVTKNGPYTVSGSIPVTQEEITDDAHGYCHTWREAARFPHREQYALCRCGASGNKPFCDGTHLKKKFNGTETAGNEPYLVRAGEQETNGPALKLTDREDLCVHARFCLRAGGIWNLVRQSDNPEARKIAIEEAGNCPSGRLVVWDRKTGKAIEPGFNQSIVVVEYPAKGEHGPLWVRGGIPIISAEGVPYEIRNRVTLCRCGTSSNKPFCDGSHRENQGEKNR